VTHLQPPRPQHDRGYLRTLSNDVLRQIANTHPIEPALAQELCVVLAERLGRY